MQAISTKGMEEGKMIPDEIGVAVHNWTLIKKFEIVTSGSQSPWWEIILCTKRIEYAVILRWILYAHFEQSVGKQVNCKTAKGRRQ